MDTFVLDTFAMDISYWWSSWRKNCWTFYEKEFQKTNEKEFRTEKVIKIKSDKLYVKWKGYNN